MVLISRVEDRKAILGLFNTAHELIHGHSDNSFPRLGQMIVEYENPMRKLADEFTPHTKLLYQALSSLHSTFHMRNLPADEWRKSQILSIISDPSEILNPSQTEAIQCEYLSIDTMERYIICKH
jgi:nck-associated protein 1